MRPDETCYGLIEGIADYICSPKGFARTCRYYEGNKKDKHSCKIFRVLKKLRKTKKKPKNLLHEFPVDDLRSFFMYCLKFQDKTSTFNDNCVKCGQCCIGKDFEIPKLWVERKNPKTGEIQRMCKHLRYYDNLNNQVDDFGWRCELFNSIERPIACIKFPTGNELVLFKKWLSGDELKFDNLPLCPAVFEEAL